MSLIDLDLDQRGSWEFNIEPWVIAAKAFSGDEIDVCFEKDSILITGACGLSKAYFRVGDWGVRDWKSEENAKEFARYVWRVPLDPIKRLFGAIPESTLRTQAERYRATSFDIDREEAEGPILDVREETRYPAVEVAVWPDIGPEETGINIRIEFNDTIIGLFDLFLASTPRLRDDN